MDSLVLSSWKFGYLELLLSALQFYFFFFVIMAVLAFLFKKYPDKGIYVGLSIFSKVFYYSVENWKKRLYFLYLQITDRKLGERLSLVLGILVGVLVSATSNVFFALLLVEITFECTEGFDCYEKFNTVNCEAVRNESLRYLLPFCIQTFPSNRC